MGYQIQQLQDRHREILRLSEAGLSHRKIAESLGLTPVTVKSAIDSNLGRIVRSKSQQARDQMVAEISARIRELAPQAVETLKTTMLDEYAPANVRLKAAQDVLDRSGLGAPRLIQANVTHGHFTPSDIEAMLGRAKEAGAIIDTEALLVEADSLEELARENSSSSQFDEILSDMGEVEAEPVSARPLIEPGMELHKVPKALKL